MKERQQGRAGNGQRVGANDAKLERYDAAKRFDVKRYDTAIELSKRRLDAP